jgi:hypothetical protein
MSFLLNLFFRNRRTAAPTGNGRFADFIRYASSSEKKKVYAKVLKRATDRQRAVMEYRAK